MNNIIKTLQSLGGVRDAYIYLEQDRLFSITAGSTASAMLEFARMVGQIFSALEVIGKDHDEIHFAVDDKMLVAYLIRDCGMVILLTDKRVNLPLLHMSVRLASAKIRARLAAGEIITPTPTGELPAVGEMVSVGEMVPVEEIPQHTDPPPNKKLLGKLWNLVYLE